MDEPRTIMLRRPPICVAVDDPFVPDVDLQDVAHRWQRLQERNPAVFDGRLMHVLGVHRNGHGGATISLVECAYRFYAVQNESFDCGIRPLGVKGITMHGDRILMGQRAAWVHQYPGLWECAPGGGVEPGADPVDVLLSELAEETGCTCTGQPVAIALLLDEVTRCWELVYRLQVEEETLSPGTDEYADLQWCRGDELPAPRSSITECMRRLLES
ncbi:MAG: NUDIX domain-containing protein [Phycisphaerales bacterium]|nr:NUDIX domain-containing protein [Phycisphaerales bacterium]